MPEGLEVDAREFTSLKASNINRGLAAIAEAGGGVLQIPEFGDIICDEPIVIDESRVELVGRGRCTWPVGGLGWSAGTRLIKDFTGAPLVLIRSQFGPTMARKEGMGLRGFLLDGNLIADGYPLLEIDSCGRLDVNVSATRCSGAGNTAVLVKSRVEAVDLANTPCVQDSRIEVFVRQVDETAERGVHCIKLQGSENANPSFNRDDCYIRATCIHWDGRAMWVHSGDNNDIFVRGVRPGGSGALFWAGAPRAGFPVGCERNWITVSGNGPIYAEGTNDSGVLAPITNVIRPDYSNGTPSPVAGTGSRWIEIGQDGDLTQHALVKGILADSRWAAAMQRALMTCETVRIFNASQANAIWANAFAEWATRVMENGDFDIAPLAGARRLSLPSGTAFGGVPYLPDENGFMKIATLRHTEAGDLRITESGDLRVGE